MEPNKLENEFRTKLQQREIAPSPAAWDRLDAMLTVAEEKKTKPNYNWLYIAASIIGFIAIGVVFFSQTQELVDVRRDNVVYQNTPTPIADSIQKENQIAIPGTSKSEKKVVVLQENMKSIQSAQRNANPKINSNQNQITNQPDAIAEHQETGTSIINQKTEQLNPINNANETNIAVTEPKLKTEKSIKVNASSLLSEVDNELTFSFREKVIQKIDKNYKTVKVALANRNQKSSINN